MDLKKDKKVVRLSCAVFLRGRPLGSGKKVQMTIRFDADIVEAFKNAGEGWQTKMNTALREWLETYSVA